MKIVRPSGDHGASGTDICVHPDPADGGEGAAVMFGMGCDVKARTMWVELGNPCASAFERLESDDLLA
jgi:hypothetical protein